jgi:hypothetical protein
MNSTPLHQVASFLMSLLSAVASAGELTPASAAFKPFGLVGEWTFVSAESGRRYGGEIKVEVKTIDSVGVMRGSVSYDGRQTNDNCSTRGMFSDEPVDAEITKTNGGYQVSFTVKCSKGESPRLRRWGLTCENAVCTQPEILPHGKGAVTLKVVH